MKEDEAGDKCGVAKDTVPDFGLHRSVLRKGEILRLDQQASNHHADHAHEHGGRQHITGDIENVPQTAARMQAKETFENIDKIHQKIKNKTVKYHRMEKRHDRPFLEHTLLGQDDP